MATSSRHSNGQRWENVGIGIAVLRVRKAGLWDYEAALFKELFMVVQILLTEFPAFESKAIAASAMKAIKREYSTRS